MVTDENDGKPNAVLCLLRGYQNLFAPQGTLELPAGLLEVPVDGRSELYLCMQSDYCPFASSVSRLHTADSDPLLHLVPASPLRFPPKSCMLEKLRL